MILPEIAAIVRESEPTVLRWLKLYRAEGANGLCDAPRPGRLSDLPANYRERLVAAVRRRPRSLNLPFSLWTLQRLSDYLAEQTGFGSRLKPFAMHSRKLGRDESPATQNQDPPIQNTKPKKDN